MGQDTDDNALTSFVPTEAEHDDLSVSFAAAASSNFRWYSSSDSCRRDRAHHESLVIHNSDSWPDCFKKGR
jgi:hypothetical protein